MDFEPRTDPSNCKDFFGGTVSVAGKLSNVPAELRQKSMLSDGWALEIRSNQISEDDLDARAAQLAADFKAHNLSVVVQQSVMGWLIFGDLARLERLVQSETIEEPFAFFARLMNDMRSLRESDRSKSPRSGGGS
jgi:hypothetical protein